MMLSGSEFAQSLPQVYGDSPLRLRHADKSSAYDPTHRHAYQQLHPRGRAGDEGSSRKRDGEYHNPEWYVQKKFTPQVLCTNRAFPTDIVIKNRKSKNKARERETHCYAHRAERQTGYKRSCCDECS